MTPQERVRMGASLRGNKVIRPYPRGGGGGGNVIRPYPGAGGGGGGVPFGMPNSNERQLGAGEGLMMAISAMGAAKAGGEYNPAGYKPNTLRFGRGAETGPPGGTGVFAWAEPLKKKKHG